MRILILLMRTAAMAFALLATMAAASPRPDTDPLTRVTVDSTNVSIPWDTVRIGAQHLIQYFGEDFLEEHSLGLLVADHLKLSGQWCYRFDWKLEFLDLVDTSCIFRCTMGLDGEMDFKVPDCRNTPAACNIVIDRPAALEIARKYGLEPGERDWQTELTCWPWFRWKVMNTLWIRDKVPRYGRVLWIDAITGRVIEEGYWNAHLD